MSNQTNQPTPLGATPRSAARSIAVTFMIVGVVFGVGGLVWDLNGGPSWLHAFTWVGGAVFGYGLVSLISTRRDPLG
ncbi:hypothetical protein [Herbiconiux daphne]|uniref:AtpZ/AtpI family protein n=1 Tax=Herbiconiux daphne TaxID=2970914 RepID=A0ABT2H1M4_9MICO|nr:hypothetical protein [Herbiconiux daphne]MCS5733812.1 hypothetical protein [Herbiconiux daphne]